MIGRLIQGVTGSWGTYLMEHKKYYDNSTNRADVTMLPLFRMLPCPPSSARVTLPLSGTRLLSSDSVSHAG